MYFDGTIYWQNVDLKSIEVLLGIIAFFSISLLGLGVFFKNAKSWTNRFFLFLVLIFDIYIIVNYFSLHPPLNTPENQLFWIRMVMVIASFMGPALFLLVHTFPKEKITLQKPIIFAVMILGFASAIASYLPFVFDGISYRSGEPVPTPSQGMVLFFLNFIGLVAASFVVLIERYKRAPQKEKPIYFYFLLGMFGSLFLIGITSLIFVVILETSSFVFLSPIFLFILISSIGYAIVKYGLFNFKVIATNILIGVIWIVLFSRIFVEKDLADRVVDLIVFILTLIFGILTISSAKKEVEEKEKLAKVSEQLEITNKQLRDANEMKSEFVSFASHQLKSPLAVIKGYSDLIADGSYGVAPQAVYDTAIKIKNSVSRLVTLIDDFLNIKRIEDGTMEYVFEERNIVEFVDKIHEDYNSIAHEKNLEISFTSNVSEIKIKIDTSKMRQVIQNLLDNSIKYTDKGWIKVAVHKESDEALIIISDSGRGFAPEFLPKLFERFHREAIVAGRAVEGSGLGLYIAKQIILAHKGDIRAESEGEGRGSTFYIRLPINLEPNQNVIMNG